MTAGGTGFFVPNGVLAAAGFAPAAPGAFAGADDAVDFTALAGAFAPLVEAGAGFFAGVFAGEFVAGFEGVLAGFDGVFAAGAFDAGDFDGVEDFFISLSTMLIFCMPAARG